jgi:hypothetical protein
MVDHIELIICLTALVGIFIKHLNWVELWRLLKAPSLRLLRLLLHFFLLRFIELNELVCQVYCAHHSYVSCVFFFEEPIYIDA